MVRTASRRRGRFTQVDVGELADGGVADVFALGVVRVPLPKAPRVGRDGVKDVPHHVEGERAP
jgi:hypothetical protein